LQQELLAEGTKGAKRNHRLKEIHDHAEMLQEVKDRLATDPDYRNFVEDVCGAQTTHP
jgi:hypothetical protein